MPDPEYVRVTDEVMPRREYSVVKSAVDPKVHTVLEDKPGAYPDGQPIPPKYTPESLSSSSTGSGDDQLSSKAPSGQQAPTEKPDKTKEAS